MPYTLRRLGAMYSKPIQYRSDVFIHGTTVTEPIVHQSCTWRGRIQYSTASKWSEGGKTARHGRSSIGSSTKSVGRPIIQCRRTFICAVCLHDYRLHAATLHYYIHLYSPYNGSTAEKKYIGCSIPILHVRSFLVFGRLGLLYRPSPVFGRQVQWKIW